VTLSISFELTNDFIDAVAEKFGPSSIDQHNISAPHGHQCTLKEFVGFFRVSNAKEAEYSKLEKLSFPLGRARLTIAWSRLNQQGRPDENVTDENGFGGKFGEPTLRRAIN
jgi:hypothetical protein